MYYIGQLQYVGVAVMAVNRYTGVTQPVKHNNVLIRVVDLLIASRLQLWQGARLKFACAVPYIFAAIVPIVYHIQLRNPSILETLGFVRKG